MKKISVIILFFTILFASCSQKDSFEADKKVEEFSKIKVNKSALLRDREFKISSNQTNEINSFIENRLDDLQKTIGISVDGQLTLEYVNATNGQCEQSYSLKTVDAPNYEVIAVKSKEGRIEGYLWNVYGKKIRSFYQQIKYNDDGTLYEILLWSQNNRIFYSTDEDMVMAEMSTNAEGEAFEQCVARVFQSAKQACDADPTCHLRCSLLPGCEACMMAAAAISCAIYG